MGENGSYAFGVRDAAVVGIDGGGPSQCPTAADATSAARDAC